MERGKVKDNGEEEEEIEEGMRNREQKCDCMIPMILP